MSELKILTSKSISDYKNLLFRDMKFEYFAFKLKILFLLILLPLVLPSRGQNGNLLNNNSINNLENSNPGSLTNRQISYLKNSYSEKIESRGEFINGKEYESYYGRSIYKPLLFPDKKRNSALFTRTRRYSNITLQYDTFLDEVIYTDTSRTINYRFPQIALNKEIVEGFNLYLENDSLIFRNFRLAESSMCNLKEGFYEIAYVGKSKYVIKHIS